VFGEKAGFPERLAIQEQIEAFARRQLARAMMLLDALHASAEPETLLDPPEILNLFFGSHAEPSIL